MAWTAPRTWTNGEIVTAAIMNAHLRDNLLVLKTTRDDAGRLTDLSSTTLASLDPTALTGLATRTAGTSYTAGRNRFQGTSRLVLPVGADKYEDLGGGLRRGNWIEGQYLHHIASNQTTEYRFLGTYVSTPAGAVAGSVWAEGNDFHYIDASGDERLCHSSDSTAASHTDASAIGGSLWVETYTHWVRESGTLERRGHNDVAHADGTVHDDHTDSVSHGDAHGDVAHTDTAGIPHTDAAHNDITHQDHNDGPGHADLAHGDAAHGDTASVPHGDVSHSDVPHTDTPHSDAPHGDHSDHGDTVAISQPTVVP